MEEEKYKKEIGILFSPYRTGGNFTIADWFHVRDLYRTDPKFRQYVDEFKNRVGRSK